MGESEDKQDQAIKFALLKQEVDNLKIWKKDHEDAQITQFEKAQSETDKRITRIEETINNFIAKSDEKTKELMNQFASQFTTLAEQLNTQKNNWMSKPPWWLTALISGLISTIVYLLTRK